MSQPRVSVIIPAYNVAHCLRAAIDSVWTQTFKSWEIVVVDDGSADATADIAQFYARDRIRCERQPNLGAGAARKLGMESSQAELVAFLDADDLWKENFLERAVGFLDAHPEAVAVSGGYIVRFVNGREEIRPAYITGENPITEERVIDDFFSFWAAHDHIHTSTVMMRRAVIEEAGYMRPELRISQDLEYFGYIATFGRWGMIPVPLGVSTSRVQGARAGWIRRYRKRRRLCPTVETWEERIVPRLKEADRPGFEIVRGRVAAGYAYHMILGGVSERARHVIEKYGASMPNNQAVCLLRAAARRGKLPWLMVCALLQFKERQKAIYMSLTVRMQRTES